MTASHRQQNEHQPDSTSISQTSSLTLSKRRPQYLGECQSSVSVGSYTEKRFISVADVAGGSPNDVNDFIPYYYISAIDFRAHGVVIIVSLQNPNASQTDADGTPTFTAAATAAAVDDLNPADPTLLSGAFVVSVKSELNTRMIGSADAVVANRLFSEGNSQEGHGALAILEKRRAFIGAYANNNRTLMITLLNFVSYRVASDEWIIFNFFENSTDPSGCVTGQIIIQIATYRFLELQSVTNILCFIALLAGIVASFVGTPLVLSQHAGAVALLSLLHFAQEDGATLPLAINVFQASIGSTKYRYVVGVLVVQTTVIAFLVIVHYLAARWVIPYVKGLNVHVAQALVRHPALSVALVLHLAPGMWFSFGRNLGNQASEQYVLNFACFSVTTYLTWIGFRDLVSSSMSVRYLPHKDRSGRLIDHGFHDDLVTSIDIGGDVMVTYTIDDEGYPIREEHCGSIALEAFVQSEESHFDATKHRPHRYLILREAFHRGTPSWLRRLLLWLDEEHGVWRSIDPLQTFLASRGHAVQHYTKRGRLWMGLEQLDIFLVALLTLVDNYTTQLASIQFGITLLSKTIMFLAAVGLNPARRTYAGLLLLMLYFFEMCAALALLIGAQRAELVPVCEVVQTAVCFICAIILVLELLCVLIIGGAAALLRVQRRQAFLSSARGRDPIARFTTRLDSQLFVDGIDLVDGELVGSELGRDASRRRQAFAMASSLREMDGSIQSGNEQKPQQPNAAAAEPLLIGVPRPPLRDDRSIGPTRQPTNTVADYDEDILELVDGDECWGATSDMEARKAPSGDLRDDDVHGVNVVDLLLEEDALMTAAEERAKADAAPVSTRWWARDNYD
jgi:hypothetical protein